MVCAAAGGVDAVLRFSCSQLVVERLDPYVGRRRVPVDEEEEHKR